MKNNTPRRYRYVIAALVCPSRFTTTLINTAAGPLLPLMMREFDISRGTVSWYVAAPQILTMICSVPAGILAGRIGLKKAFAIGAFFQAAGILTPLCFNFPLLILTRIFFGIGVAMTGPVAAGIIAQWFSRKELPIVNGFNQSSGSVGQSLAFLLTVPIAVAISWRGTLAGYSAIALINAFLWFILGKEIPPTVSPVDGTGMGKTPQYSDKMSNWRVLKQKETLFLALGLMGAFCLYMTFSAWLPTYYYEVFKMPLADASNVSAIFKITGIPASLIGGLLPARLGLRRPIIVISGLMVGVTGLACFLINNPYVIFPALAIYGVFGVIYMPSVYTIPMELPGMTPQRGALVLSLALAAGNFGGFIGPLIVGYIADFTGSYLPGLLFCCLFSLSLFIGGLLLPETGPHARAKNLK